MVSTRVGTGLGVERRGILNPSSHGVTAKNTIVNQSSTPLAGAFWLYGFVAMLGFAWLSVTLPETKGLTLEQIEEVFWRPGDNVPPSTLTPEQRQATALLSVSA